MSECYDPHMLGYTRICVKSWDAVRQQDIARRWKRSGILSPSDVAGLARIDGKTIGSSAQDEEFAALFALTMQLTLAGQGKVLIDSDIASVTTNDLWEWMDIDSDINIRKGMVEGAIVELNKCCKYCNGK